MADLLDGAVMVIAKAPMPGRSKTRLCPPLTPAQACDVAWACMHDTLATVAAVPAARRVLVLDGEPGSWIPDGFEVIAQRGDGLAERLAAAFSDVGRPAVVIAMDTPQVTADLLTQGLAIVVSEPTAASFGPAYDGGFWLLGLGARTDPDAAFSGVPMSVAHTGAAQADRLRSLGLSVRMLPELQDIDTVDDLRAVAATMPRASNLGRLAPTLPLTSASPGG